jgi:hypothetical protein
MIKSWTDSTGVRHFADEHSKAYRDRDEVKFAEGGVLEPKAEDAKPRARTVTVKPDAQQ